MWKSQENHERDKQKKKGTQLSALHFIFYFNSSNFEAKVSYESALINLAGFSR